MTVKKTYADQLEEELSGYRGEYESFIDYGPSLVRVLMALLEDEKTSLKSRRRIAGALAYFVAPIDVIPEEIYGPNGYADDIFLTSMVLKEIVDSQGLAFVESHWKGDEPLKEVLDVCFKESKRVVGDDAQKILDYVGMD